jgi:lipoate-protein ligase A
MAIYVIDTNTGDTLVLTQPGQDGSFGFQLKQGIYALHFVGEGYEELIKPLRITVDSNKEGIRLDGDLTLELAEKAVQVFEGEESQIQLRDDLYEGPAGEVLIVPIRAPRGSTLVVRTYQDSMLVGSDTLELDRRRTDLEIIPLPGISEVEIALVDEDGNIHRNRFTVVGTEAKAKHAEEQVYEEGQIVTPAGPGGLSSAGIALLELAGAVSGGDAIVLKQELSEHSDGALKDYLEKLDLEAEGIGTTEEFIKHLEEAAGPEGYSMNDVSQAMLESLGSDSEGENLEALVSQLRLEAGGALKEELENLDLEKEGITGRKALFEHLYERAVSLGYYKNEVDAMLSDVLANGDAELLRQLLIENSDGALKDYLLQLDLEEEGITNGGELLRHLEEVAEAEGFDMEDVRRAMLESLDHPLEVDRIYKELTGTTQGDLQEILKQLDLRKEGIYTVEELIEILIQKQAEKGYASLEIEQILSGLFPGQEDLILELGEKYGQDTSGKRNRGWPLILLVVAGGAGLIWFIILWWRRRDKQEELDN